MKGLQSDSKHHRLDPRHIYRSFMTGIGVGLQAEKEKKSDEGGLGPFQVRQFPPVGSVDSVETLSKNFHLAKFELFSTKVASAEEVATETLRCLWPFIRLSRLIGMCPITRQGNRLFVPKFYHPSWFITYVALCIQIIMVGNAVSKVSKAESTDALILRLNTVIYYGHTLANGLYMSTKIKELPEFLVSCKRIEAMVRKHQSKQLRPDGLVRHCFLLFLFFSTAQFMGNVLYFVQVAHKGKARSIPQFFRSFNSEFIGDWGGFYSGIFFCFGELYCDMGWTFADILLALLALVFGRYFRRLNSVLEVGSQKTVLSLAKIEELRCDHRQICHLVQLCNNLFSPLFLLTYAANVAYLFTRLYTGLSDDLAHPLFTVRMESLYAFCYQILIKILAPSYLAARLHEQAHEGLKLIHNWPSAVDSPDAKFRMLVISRFVSQLVTTPVGISGCGFFIISKSFMVTLISALVTYEVIILQFQGASIPAE